jgi:peroxiredoxin
MTRKMWVFPFVLLLSIALYVQVEKATHSSDPQKLDQQIEDLRAESADLVKAEKFAQAADKLEQLQVLLMNAGRYREALDASFEIEEVSIKASDRRSPWNYVRIAEAYLGLGDRERYFDWMEKAVDERSFTKLSYFQDARLDTLKDDPRYKKIVDDCAKLIGIGQKAEDFQVTLLDGSSFTLSAQTGKVVLIDFWNVFCAPCRKEMPNLTDIFKDFRDSGLVIIGISLDTDRKVLEDYLGKEALPWKTACSFNGWSDSTVKLYKISATPTTWLIDRHGIVRYYDVRGEQLRRAVQELTGE